MKSCFSSPAHVIFSSPHLHIIIALYVTFDLIICTCLVAAVVSQLVLAFVGNLAACIYCGQLLKHGTCKHNGFGHSWEGPTSMGDTTMPLQSEISSSAIKCSQGYIDLTLIPLKLR